MPHLPAARVDQDPQRLLATDPLARFPVRIDVHPDPGKRRLQVQPSHLRTSGASLFELHVEALAGHFHEADG